MGFPHPDILHGQPCGCTLHDIGLGCRRRLTRAGLDREVNEVVVTALRSGIGATDVVQAFMLAIERHRTLEAKQ